MITSRCSSLLHALGGIGVEIDLADGRAGGGVDALG